MSEIRCIAPRKDNRRCDWFVTRAPLGQRFHLIGLVGHSSLADPRHLVFACGNCGHFSEVRAEVVQMQLDPAA